MVEKIGPLQEIVLQVLNEDWQATQNIVQDFPIKEYRKKYNNIYQALKRLVKNQRVELKVEYVMQKRAYWRLKV